MNSKKTNTFILAGILLFISIAAVVNASSGGEGPLSGLKDFVTEDYGEFPRIYAYLTVMCDFFTTVSNDISNNVRIYVVSNPSPVSDQVRDAMGVFIRGVQAAYVFAFVATAAYLMMSSSSPKNRARSKYLLGKLIIGFLLVSISPYLLEAFYGFSSSMSAYIIDQGDPSLATAQYGEVLTKSCQASWMIVEPQILTEWFGVHRGLHGQVLGHGGLLERRAEAAGGEHALHALHENPLFQMGEGFKMAPKPDYTFPFLLIGMFFILAFYGFLALRYLMIMTWTLLFPITIFLTTFEPTKGLGRNMLEQTIFWVILQIFYAVSIDVIAAAYTAIPGGYNYYALGWDLQIINLSVSFFTVGAAIILALTPIFTLSLFQRLTAP